MAYDHRYVNVNCNSFSRADAAFEECIIPRLAGSLPLQPAIKTLKMPANHTDLEKRLWDAADELRANSKLKSSEYSVPVLGLIFLRYADHKFTEAEKKMPAASGRRADIASDCY